VLALFVSGSVHRMASALRRRLLSMPSRPKHGFFFCERIKHLHTFTPWKKYLFISTCTLNLASIFQNLLFCVWSSFFFVQSSSLFARKKGISPENGKVLVNVEKKKKDRKKTIRKSTIMNWWKGLCPPDVRDRWNVVTFTPVLPQPQKPFPFIVRLPQSQTHVEKSTTNPEVAAFFFYLSLPVVTRATSGFDVDYGHEEEKSLEDPREVLVSIIG
jgi:hypothetical protein